MTSRSCSKKDGDIMSNKMVFKDISGTAGGVLSALWRNVIEGNNLMPKLDYLTNRYVVKNNDIDTKNSKRKTKASLKANITADDLTWKTFIKLLFEFLDVRKLVITIKLTKHNGSESVHSITVNNQNFDKDE